MKKIVFCLLLVLFISCQKFDNPYDLNTKAFLSINNSNFMEINKSYPIDFSTNASQNFKVKLDLYIGEKFLFNITEETSFLETYLWLVPPYCTSGTNYKIKATSVNNENLYTYSNNIQIANWEEFSAVTNNLLAIHFLENFYDNSNGWPNTDNNINVSFSSDVYQVSNKNTNLCFFLCPYNRTFDTQKNFQIDVKIKYICNSTLSYVGFFWGSDPYFKNYYEFIYRNNTYYEFGLYNIINQSSWLILSESNTSHILNNDFNIITIRKISGMYYFFINSYYLFSYPHNTIPGANFGFEIYPNSTIYVDFVKINYIHF